MGSPIPFDLSYGMKVEQRFSYAFCTTSQVIKTSAGFIHTVSFAQADAAPTAGTIYLYDWAGLISSASLSPSASPSKSNSPSLSPSASPSKSPSPSQSPSASPSPSHSPSASPSPSLSPSTSPSPSSSPSASPSSTPSISTSSSNSPSVSSSPSSSASQSPSVSNSPSASPSSSPSSSPSTGTYPIIYQETFTTTAFRAYSILLDVEFENGLMIDFVTLADINAICSYR